MSVDTAPKLTRKRAIAFAIETTTGTPVSISATDGVTAFFDPSVKYNTEIVDREEYGGMSPILQGMGARAGTCSFETEVVGTGSSGSVSSTIWTRLLQACGYAASGGTYSPVDGNTVTGTINYYQDGRLRQLSGCMGTATFTLRRGQKARVKWTFTGVQQIPTDISIITPTWVTAVAPRVGATTFTIGGSTYRVPEVEINLGNDVILREDIAGLDSNNNPTGYRAAYITRRKPTVTISPESLALATKNWPSVFNASTTQAMVCTWGSAANNTFSFTAPALQLIEHPDIGDRNGMMTDMLHFLCTRSASAGLDELVLTLS